MLLLAGIGPLHSEAVLLQLPRLLRGTPCYAEPSPHHPVAATATAAACRYSGRPFVVGDRIQLLAGSSVVVEASAGTGLCAQAGRSVFLISLLAVHAVPFKPQHADVPSPIALNGALPCWQGVVEAVDPVRTTVIDDNRNPSETRPPGCSACSARRCAEHGLPVVIVIYSPGRIPHAAGPRPTCCEARQALASPPVAPPAALPLPAVYMSNTQVTSCSIRNLTRGQARRQAA